MSAAEIFSRILTVGLASAIVESNEGARQAVDCIYERLDMFAWNVDDKEWILVSARRLTHRTHRCLSRCPDVLNFILALQLY